MDQHNIDQSTIRGIGFDGSREGAPARDSESALGNVVADAQLAAVPGADLAFERSLASGSTASTCSTGGR